jgi:hypothetical protein
MTRPASRGRYYVRLAKRGGWFIIDGGALPKTHRYGPFASKDAAVREANKLNQRKE